MSKPTQIGPSTVQSRMAHVTTRNRSPCCIVVDDEEEVGTMKMPLAWARADIKKPISPRATMALPRMQAGYRD